MLTDEVSQIQEVSVWQVELSNTSAKFRQWVNILRLVEDMRVCVCVCVLKSTKERVLWEPEEYTETLTHIHTLDNQAEQQRFMKV